MKFSIYTLWADYTFYAYIAVFAVSAFSFLFAVRRLMAFKEDSSLDEDALSGEQKELLSQQELPDEEKKETSQISPLAQQSQPELFSAGQQDVSQKLSPAEEFVKSISDSLSDIDKRLSKLESLLQRPGLETKRADDFSLKFLEDIINDYDSLDKEKVKARIQFLISDLKK